MPMEFLHGRPLTPEELEMLRQRIEEGFDNIAEFDPEIRGQLATGLTCSISLRPKKIDMGAIHKLI